MLEGLLAEADKEEWKDKLKENRERFLDELIRQHKTSFDDYLRKAVKKAANERSNAWKKALKNVLKEALKEDLKKTPTTGLKEELKGPQMIGPSNGDGLPPSIRPAIIIPPESFYLGPAPSPPGH